MTDAEDQDPDRPRRSRLGRWLFTAEGADSPASARRNAVFLTAAAGLYVFIILGNMPPRDWSGWVQAAIAVVLIAAAGNAWRGYRKVQQPGPPPEEPGDPRG